MKVLLVLSELLSALEGSVCAPLGLLSLASVAEKSGHEVRIVNLRLNRSTARVKKMIEESVTWRPDFVGLGGVTPYATVFEQVARFYRKHLPNAFLAGGGPHSTTDNTEILEKGLVDLCVLGEGEWVFEQLLGKLAKSDDVFGLPGISFFRDGCVIENPPAPSIEDLDALPWPAWHMMDFPAYRRFSGMADFFRWSVTMFTSRGCPFRCIYCHNMFGKKFRARSPENVLGEIDLLRNKYGMKYIEFVDDIFNMNRARTISILEGIDGRFPDVKIAFPNGLRGDILDEEVIALLRRAGCWHVSIAIESASPEMQKVIGKNLDLGKIRENLSLLRKQGIFTRGFAMIGFPGESLDDVNSTMRFLMENDLNYSLIFIAAPFNKTALQKMMDPSVQKEIISDKNMIDYRLGSYSLGDIPHPVLEKIRSGFYRKGVLRLRNWRYWISAVKGLLMGGAFRRIGILLSLFLGAEETSLNRMSLQIRSGEFERFRKSLDSIPPSVRGGA